MKQLLYENKGFNYSVADTFDSNMLVPVIRNLLNKAETEWDDYDEVYHCCRLIESVRKNPTMQMDFHYIKKGQDTIGIALITRGIIDTSLFFPKGFHLADPADSILVLNYFHISTEGRGTGEYWLRDIIIPHYAEKGFISLYVKSSHPKVFSLYGRLGESIASYESESDNGLHHRSGKIFKISLQ